jgi:exosortase H (IPTLxxWG-CTERM-specific)
MRRPDRRSVVPGERARTGAEAPRTGRREIAFLLLFTLLLGGGFALISLNWVNDRAVEPFTSAVAHTSGAALRLLGQDVTVHGTLLRSPRFAVNVRNGCNGIEAWLIFLAAVLAFPAPARARLQGLAVGAVAIQAVNLVRVVALFLTGVYSPRLFDASHTVVWQSLVILASVVLWIVWARRVASGR